MWKLGRATSGKYMIRNDSSDLLSHNVNRIEIAERGTKIK